jgi:serine/threonine protein kinase
MGEVYLARDSRLGRNVAIKVSAERFNERFEREARAVRRSRGFILGRSLHRTARSADGPRGLP